jgi:hypothetical protein
MVPDINAGYLVESIITSKIVRITCDICTVAKLILIVSVTYEDISIKVIGPRMVTKENHIVDPGNVK